MNKKLKEHLEQRQMKAQAELDKWVHTYQMGTGITKRVAEYEINYWTEVLKGIRDEQQANK